MLAEESAAEIGKGIGHPRADKGQKEEEDTFEIVKLDEDVFEVVGGLVAILSRKVNMDDYDSFRYFQRVLKDKGVIKALRNAGATDGSTVIVGDIEFDFVD